VPSGMTKVCVATPGGSAGGTPGPPKLTPQPLSSIVTPRTISRLRTNGEGAKRRVSKAARLKASPTSLSLADFREQTEDTDAGRCRPSDPDRDDPCHRSHRRLRRGQRCARPSAGLPLHRK